MGPAVAALGRAHGAVDEVGWSQRGGGAGRCFGPPGRPERLPPPALGLDRRRLVRCVARRLGTASRGDQSAAGSSWRCRPAADGVVAGCSRGRRRRRGGAEHRRVDRSKFLFALAAVGRAGTLDRSPAGRRAVDGLAPRGLASGLCTRAPLVNRADAGHGGGQRSTGLWHGCRTQRSTSGIGVPASSAVVGAGGARWRGLGVGRCSRLVARCGLCRQPGAGSPFARVGAVFAGTHMGLRSSAGRLVASGACAHPGQPERREALAAGLGRGRAGRGRMDAGPRRRPRLAAMETAQR